jgi:putative methyltransferase (TIGR04325 family)
MLPKHTIWTVAELPEAVALGTSIGQKRGEQVLGFIDSSQISDAAPASLFLTAGTLQYMEDSLSKTLQDLKQKPKHVLVHHLPVHKTKSFWTLQKLFLCEVPYRVYEHQTLIADMQRLAYNLVSEWQYPRTIEIPFWRNQTSIEGYLGFYFKLDSP